MGNWNVRSNGPLLYVMGLTNVKTIMYVYDILFTTKIIFYKHDITKGNTMVQNKFKTLQR